MAGEPRASVLDALKAGAVVVEADGVTSEPPKPVAGSEAGSAGTPSSASPEPASALPGAPEDDGGLEPADAFGPDPIARTISSPAPGAATAHSEPELRTGAGQRDGRGSPEANAKRAATRAANKARDKGIEFTEWMLVRIHVGIGMVLGSSHWELEPEEATKFHAAIVNLAGVYGFDFDPRTKAWVDLIMIAGTIYTPRVLAHRMMAKLEAEKRKQEQARVATEAPEQPEPVERNNRPADANGAFGARPGFGSVSAALEGVTHPSQIPGMRGAAN